MKIPPVTLADPVSPWRFACPICGHALLSSSRGAGCVRCERIYARASGIWRFLPEEYLAPYEQFLSEYQMIRRDQGWGYPDAAYFLALPRVATGDPQRAIWQRRNKSFRLLSSRMIRRMASDAGKPLRILDLGAGNCWLAYQLTALGHQVAAIDLSVDPIDGLGAHSWYGMTIESARMSPFTPIQADFNRLPFQDHSADVALFNASLHYSERYEGTLREAIRVLSPGGVVVVMDSPVYRDAGGGQQMVRERASEFECRYGFKSDSIAAENFLTTGRLTALAEELALHWRNCAPAGLRSRVMARWRTVRGLRELATMPLLVGYRE